MSWDIGTEIDAVTDPDYYAAFHNDDAGGPFVFFELGPYAPDSDRYPGFYDRSTRTGTIVPVNTVSTQATPSGLSAPPPLTLVYYELGTKLLDAETGSPARDSATREVIETFGWPYQPVTYNPAWPAGADTIIIARQDGSGDIGSDTYGDAWDVYYQNDPALTGFNPNEEHALLRPYGASEALFALRDDLNQADSSDPYAFLYYLDPNDDDRAKLKAYHVVAEQAPYFFHEWAGYSGDDDPYEGSAGAFIQAPYPLSTFAYSPMNEGVSGPVFEDRTGRHWAKGAGHNVVGVDPNTGPETVWRCRHYHAFFLYRARRVLLPRTDGAGGK